MEGKKGRICLAAAMVLYIICLVSGGRTGLRKGIDLGDDFFYREGSGLYQADKDNYLKLYRQGETERAYIVLDGQEQEAEIRWTGSDVEVIYTDGAVTEGTWGNGCLLDREGMPIIYRQGAVTVTDGGEPLAVRKEVLSDALCRISRGALGVRGSAGFILLGTVLYALGIFAIKDPESSFFLLNRWRYRRAELSEEGKAVEQIGGLVFLLSGAVLVSGIFLLM